MKDLYAISEEMCGTLTNELDEANDKVKSMRGKISAGDLDYIDHLTHALKSIKTIMAMCEAYDEYSNRRYSGYSNGYSNGYSRTTPYYNQGTNMASGRYSRSKEDMIMELHRLMNEAPDEPTRMKFQKLIDELR